MRVLFTSAAFALSAVQTCYAQTPLAQFFVGGPWISYGNYGNYTLSVPEDGSKVAVTNTMPVITIIPSDTKSNCTFVFAAGTVVQFDGNQQDPDVNEQALVSVTCAARSGPVVTPTDFPNFTNSWFTNLQTVVPTASSTSSVVSSTATSVLSSTASASVNTAGSKTVPPYPTATGSSSHTGPTAVPSSIVSGHAKATGGLGNGTTVPFTGDAVRAAKSVGGSLLAFVGLMVAL